MVARLLPSGKNGYDDYRDNRFHAAFSNDFSILTEIPVTDVNCKLFLMQLEDS